MMNTVRILTLRQITKYTCRISVPPDYLRTHGLQPGDRVLWVPQDDGVLLKFTSREFHERDTLPGIDGEAA